MEVFLRGTNSVPEGCQLSVRAGHTRRQVPVNTGKALTFPPEAAHSNEIHVEVLSVLGATTLQLQPQSGANTTYMATFSDNADNGMSCILEVARTPVRAELGNSCNLGVNGSSTAARKYEAMKTSDKQAYLDRTDLLRVVQDAMKETIDTQPECPLQHMAEILRSKAFHDNHAEKVEVAHSRDINQPADNSTDEGPESPLRHGIISDTRLNSSDSEDVAEPPSSGSSDGAVFPALAGVSGPCDTPPMASTRSEEVHGFSGEYEGCEAACEFMPTMVAYQCANGALDACLIQVSQPEPSATEGSECLDVTTHPLGFKIHDEVPMPEGCNDNGLLDDITSSVARQLLEEHAARASESVVPKFRCVSGEIVDEDLQSISSSREGSVLPDMNVTMHPLHWQSSNEAPMLGDCSQDEPLERITHAVTVQMFQEHAGIGQAHAPWPDANKLSFLTDALEDGELQAIDTHRDDGLVLSSVATRSLAKAGADEAVGRLMN